MKDKIVAALKNKFKTLGFSDKAYDGVADYLSKTVIEESAIETAVSGVENLLKSFQGDIDKRVTDAVAKAKAEKTEQDKKDPEKGADPGKKTEPKNEGGDDAPAWAKKLMESNQKLEAELNTLKSGRTFETRKQSLEAKLKDAPAKFKEKILKDFTRMSFEKDEEFDTYLSDTEKDLADFNQELADKGLSNHTKPIMGGKNQDGVSKGVSEFIAAQTAKEKPLTGKEV